MTFLGYLLVLTGVTWCAAAPASGDASPGSCEVPPRFNDKELQGDWDAKFYAPNTIAQYLCRPGFSRLGSISFECKNGEWRPKNKGQCKKRSCGHPGDIDFGTFELTQEEEFVLGAIVTYTCNEGYQMISRHRTRECTANGWTNYRPECEVKYCSPVHIENNVNLLTTSYEEEYSVGQVIRFECKNPTEKIKGASEIFCMSDGNWNAPTPTCEEVSCIPPDIVHGSVTVSNPNHRYKDKDTIEFSCDFGYKASTSSVITCTKNDWIPMPVCEEIVCYQETPQNGNVQYTKETYRNGDTVILTCKEGYQIEHNPEEPRRCTAHGWNPPLKCISKKCAKPNILNGKISSSWQHTFPKHPGSSFYYYCNDGFLPPDKQYYRLTYCTNNGWDLEPKCYRKCSAPSQNSINAYLTHTYFENVYIEGEKLRFQCYGDYSTLDGQTVGEIECLPDGRFSEVTCHKTCPTPELINGAHKTNKNVYAVGAYFIYECNEGFISNNGKVEGSSECTRNGWDPKPECKGISCNIPLKNREEITIKSGEVVHFQCPRNYKLHGSNSSQCFYYGWSPALPTCKDSKNRLGTLGIDSSKREESKCLHFSEPPHAQVINPKDEYFIEDEIEIKCNPGYLLYGSEKVKCEDGKWSSPPRCIEKVPCYSSPPRIPNGEIIKETLAATYFTGSTVKYKCADGYHITGSDESKCLDGKWQPSPTCVGNSCGNPPKIDNGNAKDGWRDYKHSESAAYECSPGYKLSGAAMCLLGKWTKVPKCTNSKCGSPPRVKNGVIRGQEKTTYMPGDKVIYDCDSGFTMGQNINSVTCQDSAWTDAPECRRVGQACVSPPVVQFAEIEERRQQSYRSGSSVTYKCANWHTLEGNKVIKCKDGEWEKEPVCRVPCTVPQSAMQQNNIQLKYKSEEEKKQKLYSVHSDNITFECISGYEILDPKLLRIQCLDGVLKYPKCLKRGYCILKQEEMANNNIRYNKSIEVENGQTIEFECEAGTVPQNDLKATCTNKQINYPKCSAGRSCRLPNISNASVYPNNVADFQSGTSVEIKCEEDYVLQGHIRVNCDNGEWDDIPQCLKPCTISPQSLDTNHIELKSENSPQILKHGTEINVKCKTGFKRPGTLIASCYNGTMKYPRCFSGGFCRIIQQDLDNNFLELDEGHENEVFYEEEETVRFKCKAGYINKTELTGTCTKKEKLEYILTYPNCGLESAV